MSEDFERGQQVGAILAKLEAMDKRQIEWQEESVDDRRRIRESVIRLQDNLLDIEHKLSTARFFWMILRACAITVFMLVTFKFGDIAGVWKAIVK